MPIHWKSEHSRPLCHRLAEANRLIAPGEPKSTFRYTPVSSCRSCRVLTITKNCHIGHEKTSSEAD
eukprot:2351897-Pyramimonas_sp.AAC.1